MDNFSYYKYTHSEIHPSMILGVLATNIPFSEHNAGVRNLFQGAMGKQALGIYSTAFRKRMDTQAHILHYPQKPIVNTIPSKYIHSSDIPGGQMAIVAIACYTGYNQEDSMIFNKSAIERGLFGSSFYRTYKDEEKKNSALMEDEKFMKPEKFYSNGKVKTEKISHGSYDKLDKDGFVKVGSHVEENDIIIGKVTALKNAVEGEDPKFRDMSTSVRSNESGIVDMVYKNSNGDGYNFVKVRIRTDMRPEIGDKFSCYDEETEILTMNRGWIHFRDLTKEDEVATLVNGNTLVYENPSEVMSYDFDGELYRVNNGHLDIAVTQNHRMWIREEGEKDFKIVLAEEVIGKKYVCMTHADSTDISPIVNKDKKEDYLERYTGKVYCCTVSSGIVYVRRNGIPVWCGNSRH
jgi:DNA-directed RNA polymerase II subunit RPB2